MVGLKHIVLQGRDVMDLRWRVTLRGSPVVDMWRRASVDDPLPGRVRCGAHGPDQYAPHAARLRGSCVDCASISRTWKYGVGALRHGYGFTTNGAHTFRRGEGVHRSDGGSPDSARQSRRV